MTLDSDYIHGYVDHMALDSDCVPGHVDHIALERLRTWICGSYGPG